MTASVLITGGSRGLGEALVASFLARGDRVATCSRSASEAIEAWQADPKLRERFHYVPLDLSDADSCAPFVAGVIDRFGGVDVLVNNAGLASDGVIGLMADAEMDSVIDLNVKATLRVTRLVSRRMLLQGAGRIINVSSVVGLRGYRGLAAYSASKAALDGLTRALSRELGPRGITVNSVAPGYLRTEMTHGLDEEQLDQIARRTPLGRLGEVDDVAVAVMFLASREAGFVNGHVLVVDGGLTA